MSIIEPIVAELNKNTGENMKRPKKTRTGTSAVFGVLLLVILCFAFGIIYFGYVKTNLDFAASAFNNQMVSLLLKSFMINATHIVACLQNTGSAFIELTNAYVNGLITTLTSIVKIAPLTIGTAIMQGSFQAGNTYSVKLANVFNTEVSFLATL